jgi:hypothetical protein
MVLDIEVVSFIEIEIVNFIALFFFVQTSSPVTLSRAMVCSYPCRAELENRTQKTEHVSTII